MRNKIHKSIGLPLLVILLLAAGVCWAGVAGRPRQTCGNIQSVDHETRKLTLEECGDRKRLALGWDEETKFIQNGEYTSSSRLEAGAHAQISYRSPFIGEAFLLKVRWPVPCPKKK